MTITNDFFNRLAPAEGESVWENKLDGEWIDNFGWNFITQPQEDMPGGSDFEMQFQQMRETITFKRIGIPRNVGITGEAGFWQAIAYEVGITTPDGQGIHHEMGHFLLKVLDDVEGQTPEPLRGDIIRQATIPRANAMLTLGELRPGSIEDAIAEQETPFYNARPQTTDDALQARINTEFEAKKQAIAALSGPDLDRPLDWLQTVLADDPVDVDWVFEFRHDRSPSQMAHGQRVVNPVSIGNLLSDFWIAKRERNDETIDILQYAQKVNLIFHGIEWPHVALNTLVKQQ
jgi:hypothetical protein